MVIYAAVFGATLGLLVLASVYIADLYEREPLQLIQNVFLTGMLTQLVLVLGLGAATRLPEWTASGRLLSLLALVFLLPPMMRAQQELDERFDGVVYGVAFACGSACVIHLFNLPARLEGSLHPHVLAGAAAPDLRDILILLTGPGPRSDLLVLLAFVLQAALVGAVLGSVHIAGRSRGVTWIACGAAAIALWAADTLLASWWPSRLLLAAATIAMATSLKRRSRHRAHPQEPEGELALRLGTTVLVVLGACTLTLALLMAVSEPWSELAAPATDAVLAHPYGGPR